MSSSLHCLGLRASVALMVLTLSACGGTSLRDNPDFADAARYTFSQFEIPEEADLAFAVRQLERELYLTIDLEANAVADRALGVAPLRPEDLWSMTEVPDVYPDGFDGEGEPILPGSAHPLAIARLSSHDLPAHTYPTLEDQREVEPASPDHYEREFLGGTELCWPGRECDELLTDNLVTKSNALMEMTYPLRKDYRWVDLALPDPATVPEGEPIVPVGDSRWAVVARSWNVDSAVGVAGSTAIFQSYSIEVWLPRDGRGFLRSGDDENVDGGEWTTDSDGGGMVRMMAVWAETSFGMDALVELVTLDGIDDIFVAQEDWMDAQSEDGI